MRNMKRREKGIMSLTNSDSKLIEFTNMMNDCIEDIIFRCN